MTIATTLPPPPSQITTANRDLYIFGDFGLNSSSIAFLISRKPHWHAGCCIRSKKTLLTMCDASFNSTLNKYQYI